MIEPQKMRKNFNTPKFVVVITSTHEQPVEMLFLFFFYINRGIDDKPENDITSTR